MKAVFRLSVAVLLVALVQLAARAADPIDRLRTHITQAMTEARGRMGVAIKHLESGTEIAVNADEKFPMASTFKLPVLVTLYDKAKNGQLAWDETVDVGVRDQHLGSGDLSYLYDVPGAKLSLHNVANLMMMVSDNSGADICLTRAGVNNVNALMASLGAGDLHVDRPTQELILDYQGRDTARLKGMTLAEIQKRAAADAPPQTNAVEARFKRDDAFAADPRDQATPRAFVTLLEKMWRGEVVDKASSDAMLETMKRCRTGAGRIKGLLPPNTVVAHKTGTIGGVVDDVGIIYLPDDAGHVAIAVMSKQTRATDVEVERAIAQIARYAYDYFVFTARQGAHSAPARERSGARGPRERPSRGVGQSPT
jgi:beta-lactamase class A